MYNDISKQATEIKQLKENYNVLTNEYNNLTFEKNKLKLCTDEEINLLTQKSNELVEKLS